MKGEPPVSAEDRYWAEMGRSTAPASRAEIGKRVSILGYQLGPILARIPRGLACDVGCGRGENLLALQTFGFAPIRGCDLGTPQVDAARAAGVDAAVAEATSWLAEVRGAALITAIDVLEHMSVADGEGLLQAAYRALVPGGWFVAQFPNCASPFGGAIQFSDPTHIRQLTPDLMKLRMRTTGFTEVVALEVGPVPHSPFGIVRTAAWTVLHLGLRLWDAIETGQTADRPYTRVCIVAGQRGL